MAEQGSADDALVRGQQLTVGTAISMGSPESNAPSADAVRPGETRFAHRPHLDGLRAVAVYLVVAFHSGADRLAGGFIGVDVFFVLSGYLVTGILIRDIDGRGAIRWLGFYARRVRRLLPAAFVTLITTAIGYAIIASPTEILDNVGGFRAAFVYIANWHFAEQSTDYFASDVARSPVLHFWSLAVEEQFYLLWPIMLGALAMLTRGFGARRWDVVRGLVALGVVASAFRAMTIATDDLDRAYYGTDTRAYQLLAGALLALTPSLFRVGPRRSAAFRFALPAMFGALLFLAGTAVSVSPITRGVLVTGLTATLIVALDNADGGAVKRLLSSRPLTYLGRISYGTYLWHWPLIMLATYDHGVGTRRLLVIGGLGGTIIAAISFHLIEHPVRVSRVLDRARFPVVACGLALSLLSGLVVIPAILDPNEDAEISAANPRTAVNSEGELLNWRKALKDIAASPTCLDESIEKCVVVRGSGQHMMLVGDSNAKMWVPMFERIAEQNDMTLSVAVMGGCPWQSGLQYAGALAVQRECARNQNDWYTRLVPELDPDIIVLAQHGYDDPARPNRFIGDDGTVLTIDEPEYQAKLIRTSDETIRQLERPGRDVVILEPIPVPPRDLNPIACLASGNPPDQCTFDANSRPTPLEQHFRALARGPALSSVDVDRIACPRLPICDAVVGDIIVNRDFAHLTATYAASLWRSVEAELRKSQVIER